MEHFTISHGKPLNANVAVHPPVRIAISVQVGDSHVVIAEILLGHTPRDAVVTSRPGFVPHVVIEYESSSWDQVRVDGAKAGKLVFIAEQVPY